MVENGMEKGRTMRKRAEGSLQPPDGGWGWLIVLGSAVSHMFLIPILQNFTLIFKERFVELEFTPTDITTLVSLNVSFGMILGLLNGPLLKIFGYRKVALVGLTLYVIGILCTGIAGSYFEFIVFYGLLSSAGMMMVMASFSLATNSYFQKNRSKAVGYTMTLAGLGPIILPFVISHLLSSYGLKWTVFLLSGLNLHAYIGVLLLQPVKWHMKLRREDIQYEDKENKIFMTEGHSFLEMSVWDSKMSLPTNSIQLSPKMQRAHSRDVGLANNHEVKRERIQPRKMSITHMDNDDYKNMMNSTLYMFERLDLCEKNLKYASVETLSPECGKYLNDFEKNLVEPLNPKVGANDREAAAVKPEGLGPLKSEKSGLLIRVIRFIRDIYDLDLLNDPFYLNIMFGLSVAFVGEVMFSTMTPVILREMGFSTEDTATFLSVVAGSDLLCRFLAPFVGQQMKLNSKKMYLMALCMLLLSRACLYLVSTFETCLLVSLGLGIGKGFRSVFWVLVLPDYVPISKLPSASAIQSTINGILILVSGPLLGAITDLTKSYLSIVVASNVLTLITIILWWGEIIYLSCKKKTKASTVVPYSLVREHFYRSFSEDSVFRNLNEFALTPKRFSRT